MYQQLTAIKDFLKEHYDLYELKNEKAKIKIPGFFKAISMHRFHLVEPSLLPAVTGIALLLLTSSIVGYWRMDSTLVNIGLHVGFFLFYITLYVWLEDVSFESRQGHHTDTVQNGLRFGVILFIVSEVMFFFAFFWAYFHFSLSPSFVNGFVWPPRFIQPLEMFGLPLINTILLLSSGFSLVIAHYMLVEGKNTLDRSIFFTALVLTIMLGTVFLVCQYTEYKYGLSFSWNENIFGTTFFVTTGFHGFHVCLGTFMLIFAGIREFKTNHYKSIFEKDKKKSHNWLQGIENSYTGAQHIGFEVAAWYWHFVDVVWLFLYIVFYCWGGSS